MSPKCALILAVALAAFDVEAVEPAPAPASPRTDSPARILGEALTVSRAAGALAIMGGLVALGWDGLANHGDRTWLGDLMFALGGLFWASYTIGSRVLRVEPLHATAVVSVLSMALYLPAYALLAGGDLAAAPWREIVIQAVFQGVLSAVVAANGTIREGSATCVA